jgi:tRNA(Met) cytidine acetyltransferase
VVVLCPDLEQWPEDVGGGTARRLAASFERWATVWRVDADGAVKGPTPPSEPAVTGPRTSFQPRSTEGARFSDEIFLACRTEDQAAAVSALEALVDRSDDGPVAVVLSADRGRGKSSSLGLAARGLAAAGASVVVTGPGPEAVVEVQARVAELGGSPPPFVSPADVATRAADVVLVDEAAALSAPALQRIAADAPRVAFATTMYGYEGAGMGFDVRFREHLERRGGTLVERRLDQPVRWGPGDPVEDWARAALLLGARPAESAFFHTVRPEEVAVEAVTGAQLAEDEELASQLVGLLTLAHPRTAAKDLARLFDAPDVEVRCAMWREAVVGALVLVREGGLPMETCEGLLEGRLELPGQVLPELLICQLAEEGAGTLDAWRVSRLAVHPAAQRRGVGRCLLWAAVDEARDEDIDYLGARFAATGDLLRFWNRCGLGVVQMDVTRSPVSGEHPAVVLRPTSDWGERLAGRLQAAFVRRFPHVLADALSRLEPPVALAALGGSLVPEVQPEMAPDDWNVLLASAFGPAQHDATVQPAWELVRGYLCDSKPRVELELIQRTLLLTRVIQHRPWAEAAACCGIDDVDEARRQLRLALRPLILAYGPTWARKEAERFRHGEPR